MPPLRDRGEFHALLDEVGLAVVRDQVEHGLLDRIRRAGYLRGARSWAVGENIAWGSGRLSTPRAIGRAWMNSPGHRANILRAEFAEVGVGVAYDAPIAASKLRSAVYTTDFGGVAP